MRRGGRGKEGVKERERKSRKSDGGLHRVSDEKRECRQEEEQSGRKSQRRRMGGKENKRPCEHRDKFSTGIMRKMEGNAEELMIARAAEY